MIGASGTTTMEAAVVKEVPLTTVVMGRTLAQAFKMVNCPPSAVLCVL
jgi:hypothetical protein